MQEPTRPMQRSEQQSWNTTEQQNNSSIPKASADKPIISSSNKLWRRTSSNGHRRHQPPAKHHWRYQHFNKSATSRTWWSTVEQQPMFVQHGLQQASRPMSSTQHKQHNWEQQQKTSLRSMATNGSTCRTATINTSSYHSTCVTFHNPFCQSTDWQNKASTSHLVTSQQLPTATALKQSSNRKMAYTSCQSQQQCHQPRSLMSTTPSTASRQPFHQSPSHQREHNGWLTTTTFGPTTAEDTLSGNIVDNVEHSSHQIHNVQSQKTDWKTTEEQLPTRQTAQQKTSKNNTKTCSHNTGGDYSTQHGLEKRGSKWRWTHVLHHHHCQRQQLQQRSQKHCQQQSISSLCPSNSQAINSDSSQSRKHCQHPTWGTQQREQLQSKKQQKDWEEKPQHTQHQGTLIQQKVIGSEKVTCGKESTLSQEQHSTCHNKQWMDQTSPRSFQNEQHSFIQQQAAVLSELMMIGQQSKVPHSTWSGQAQQTLKKQQPTKRSTSRTTRSTNVQHGKQQASKHQHSQQHKSEQNMSSHTYLTGLCVQHVSKTKDAQTTIHDKRQQSKLPVIQFDFCFLKAHGETSTTPILTGIDVETGLSMAILVGSKTQDFNYHAQAISTFLMECGRVQCVLNNTILQSDQEEYLMALLKAAATRTGGNISVRQSPTYTSQAQGSVERFHRTLMGQIRTLKSQLYNNYGIHLTAQHPLMPWLVRHTAYLLNRYAVHADGNTSYFRRWNREHKTPICEFGETVQYMLPTAKQLPKLEQRFFPGIWLGKDTASNENIIGIANKVVKARTIRRQPLPEKYKQLMDVVSRSTITKFNITQPFTQPLVFQPNRRPVTNIEATQTAETATAASPLPIGDAPTTTSPIPVPAPTAPASSTPVLPAPALADSPMATASTSCHSRPALPSPTKRGSEATAAEPSLSTATAHQWSITTTTTTSRNSRATNNKAQTQQSDNQNKSRRRDQQHTPVKMPQNNKQPRSYWIRSSITQKDLINKRRSRVWNKKSHRCNLNRFT